MISLIQPSGALIRPIWMPVSVSYSFLVTGPISSIPLAKQISFPWFSDGLDADTVKAYTDFIAALCKMSREQKRISSTEKAVENEKYAFRCLLLRLGFVGAEYKADRKILLKNLTGSSAFKSGAKKEAADDEISK